MSVPEEISNGHIRVPWNGKDHKEFDLSTLEKDIRKNGDAQKSQTAHLVIEALKKAHGETR